MRGFLVWLMVGFIAVMRGRVDGDFELLGEQHERFEDTLP